MCGVCGHLVCRTLQVYCVRAMGVSSLPGRWDILCACVFDPGEVSDVEASIGSGRVPSSHCLWTTRSAVSGRALQLPLTPVSEEDADNGEGEV